MLHSDFLPNVPLVGKSYKNTRSHVKKALHDKNILINGKVAKNEKNVAVLFDVITIIPSKKNYRIELCLEKLSGHVPMTHPGIPSVTMGPSF